MISSLFVEMYAYIKRRILTMEGDVYLINIFRIALAGSGVALATGISGVYAAEYCPATAAEGIASTTDRWEKYAWPDSASEPEQYAWHEARLEDYRNLVQCTYVDRSLAATAPGREVQLRRFYAAGYPNPVDPSPSVSPETDFHWKTDADLSGNEYRICSLGIKECGWTLSPR